MAWNGAGRSVGRSVGTCAMPAKVSELASDRALTAGWLPIRPPARPRAWLPGCLPAGRLQETSVSPMPYPSVRKFNFYPFLRRFRSVANKTSLWPMAGRTICRLAAVVSDARLGATAPVCHICDGSTLFPTRCYVQKRRPPRSGVRPPFEPFPNGFGRNLCRRRRRRRQTDKSRCSMARPTNSRSVPYQVAGVERAGCMGGSRWNMHETDRQTAGKLVE